MVRNYLSSPALAFPFALTLCWLSAALAMPVEGQTSEWGPIGTRVVLGFTGAGPSGGFGLDIYPGLAGQATLDSEPRREAETQASLDRSIHVDGNLSHIVELDIGFAEIENDQRNSVSNSGADRELDVFFLSAGYKFRRGWKLDGSSPQDEVDEAWRELRWLGSVGLGLYDLGDTQRLGAYAKVAGQYAFARHASQAIELAVSYHRPSSEQSFHQIQLGFVWHLSRRD